MTTETEVEYCEYDGSDMIGKPIGMFYCPACGVMICPGMKHKKGVHFDE